ncbi:MAG: hypothetical protein HY725_05375 [Candidatus Rokubacteria bacterium]|nr:hypothetical protein [Candidatus Rokubacteria bacterium]
MWERVRSWRFWTLVAVTVVDGLVFVIPIALTAMLVGALIAPDWLRGAARFLDALADGR